MLFCNSGLNCSGYFILQSLSEPEPFKTVQVILPRNLMKPFESLSDICTFIPQLSV